MKLSDIYGMDIYNDGGQYLGEVHDAIIDLEKGEVSRLLMEEWRNNDKDLAKRVLQNKSILFKNVKNVGDVVLVSAGSLGGPAGKLPESSGQEVSDLTR